MDVSIIIVNYRSWRSLRVCLDSISEIVAQKLTFEVIIVDNFSDDGEFEIFKNKYQNFIFIKNERNTGFSNGCRGLDFEFYEIHFANEEIAQNIEKLFQIKNNDMENTKSKSVFIRNKNRIYSLSYFWGSTLDKDVYNDSNIVFEELKKAIKEFSNVKF